MYKTITLTTTQTIIEDGKEKKIITATESLVATTPEEAVYDEMKAMYDEMIKLRKNIELAPVDSYDRRRLREISENAKDTLDSLYVDDGKVYDVLDKQERSLFGLNTKRKLMKATYNTFIDKYENVISDKEVREALKK